ncbi:MAG: N-acetylmuramoyl-L-alanine amidase [Myxococcaceae bacterium]|nr:N-acetylmuramoyl-L-alanine amidase [Myxococcaceae bacterium]
MRWFCLLLAACAEPPFEIETDDPRGPGPAVLAPVIVDAGAPTWPRALAPLVQLPVAVEAPKRKWRVLIDAGHGAKDNHGNTGLHCQRERDVTLSIAFGLATRLNLMGPFEARLAREDEAEPSYQARKVLAEVWPADAVVSLHTDVRGEAKPFIEGSCMSWRNDARPGFSVLWSDEGTAALGSKRQRLSWAITDALSAAGFKAYDGVDYVGLYDSEPEHVGSFINRRNHGKRIWFLRSLEVPAVIVETHHALDFDEVERWSEMRTRNVFAYAIAKGLLDYFAE